MILLFVLVFFMMNCRKGFLDMEGFYLVLSMGLLLSWVVIFWMN